MKGVRPLPSRLLVLCCGLAALLALVRPALLDAAPVGSGHWPPGARPFDGGPSLSIFPAQSVPLRFSHRKHASELGMPCTACHDGARTSTNSADRLLPPATRCDACHGSDHRNLLRVRNLAGEPIGECGFCHVGYRAERPFSVAPVVLPAPNLKFNHAAHAQRNIDCAECHGAVDRVELATRDQLPRMQGCLRCHQLETAKTALGAASGACSTCHLSEAGRLKTRFGAEPLLPPRWLYGAEHGPDWIERHRRVAGDASQFCANCHSEKYCTDCHDGRVRPRRVHPNDFLSMHAVSARQNSSSCTSCHQPQSFCLGCHQRTGITESGPFGNFASRGRIHPPPAVWTDTPRSPRHHAWEAQRNLNVCTSCHVERDCVNCHSTRAVGGPVGGNATGSRGANPHAPGFRTRCARALRQNPRACLVCHSPTDRWLQECR